MKRLFKIICTRGEGSGKLSNIFEGGGVVGTRVVNSILTYNRLNKTRPEQVVNVANSKLSIQHTKNVSTI